MSQATQSGQTKEIMENWETGSPFLFVGTRILNDLAIVLITESGRSKRPDSEKSFQSFKMVPTIAS